MPRPLAFALAGVLQCLGSPLATSDDAAALVQHSVIKERSGGPFDQPNGNIHGPRKYIPPNPTAVLAHNFFKKLNDQGLAVAARTQSAVEIPMLKAQKHQAAKAKAKALPKQPQKAAAKDDGKVSGMWKQQGELASKTMEIAGEAAQDALGGVIKRFGSGRHPSNTASEDEDLASTRRTVSIQPDSNGKFGFVTKTINTRQGTVLFIEDIVPHGPVDRHNQGATKVGDRIEKGDRILQINNYTSDGTDLAEELQEVKIPNGPKVQFIVEELSREHLVPLAFEKGRAAAWNAGVQISRKGVKEYFRESLPYDLGKNFINANTNVTKCIHITSPLLCSDSVKHYGIDCAGWTGKECLDHGDVTCAMLQSPDSCKKSLARFGIECAGWGGSSCLEKDSDPARITSQEICEHAEKRLGIPTAGWGGTACLGREATCADITLPGICNSAEAKLGMACKGWGGSRCLDDTVTAQQITTEALCKQAPAKFGIEVRGWGGKRCLPMEKATCEMVTNEHICNAAQERLGLDCAGWGGRWCLEKGASPKKITSAGICAKSMLLLGIPSGGWSGHRCLPDGPVTCSQVTAAGVCNDAANRLGIDCAGWSGKQCLAPGEVSCERLQHGVCGSAAVHFGIRCAWSDRRRSCVLSSILEEEEAQGLPLPAEEQTEQSEDEVSSPVDELPAAPVVEDV